MILNLPTFSLQGLLAPGPRDTSITVLRRVMTGARPHSCGHGVISDSGGRCDGSSNDPIF